MELFIYLSSHEYGVVGVASNGPSISPNCMSSMHIIKYKYLIHPPVNISNMCFPFDYKKWGCYIVERTDLGPFMYFNITVATRRLRSRCIANHYFPTYLRLLASDNQLHSYSLYKYSYICIYVYLYKSKIIFTKIVFKENNFIFW